MITPASYLAIPSDYTESLRWSPRRDAVEMQRGQTFAVVEEIIAFLDGFASQRPLIHFAHILHLLSLLRYGSARDDLALLPLAWEHAGRPARTAGAFLAHLCELVPWTPSPVDAGAVRHYLEMRRSPEAEGEQVLVEDTPFTRGEFESVIAVALEEFSLEELVLGLKHGQPITGEVERLADVVETARPPSLGEVLAEIAKHERIAGAAPLVDRLVGALALPPRRLADHRLPLGGYADVGTRGNPEQILPAQFALDDLEFLRRHAERELLYYRREEPHTPTRETLIVLLDQGVRTWGRVRLALAGCLLALGERARRRRQSFLVATTANGGECIDPLAGEVSELADLVAASDLTPHPGVALIRVVTTLSSATPLAADLEEQRRAARRQPAGGTPGERRGVSPPVHDEGEPCGVSPRVEAHRGVVRSTRGLTHHGSPPTSAGRDDASTGGLTPRRSPILGDCGPCDIVLLTHPRNLDDDTVRAAAARIDDQTRLFAVAVAASGEVTFEEMRHGLPVRLGRFHVDLDIPAPVPRTVNDRRWSGELEPVPWPFRFGPGGAGDPFVFVFDHEGEHLLAALPHGMLLLMRRDGTEQELLPRVMLDGSWVSGIHAVLGVADGFVITGRLPGKVVAAHYAISTRQVRTYTFASQTADLRRGLEWRYLRRTNRLLLRVGDLFYAVNLLTGQRDEPFPENLRWTAPEPHSRHLLPLPAREEDAPSETRATWAKPQLELRASWLILNDVQPEWPAIRPRSDGGPALLNLGLMRAECRGDVLAVLFLEPDRKKSLWLFGRPDGQTQRVFRHSFDRDAFALSHDGRYVAVQTSTCELEVVETAPGGTALGRSMVGRFHNNISVYLGDQELGLLIDRRLHRLTWRAGVLQATETQRGGGIDFQLHQILSTPAIRAEASQVPAFLHYDRARFRGAAQGNLIAAVTLFGEVYLFEPGGELVGGFFTFRNHVAAWMPDGTCWGSETLLGQPETPDAAARIGQALSEAWKRNARASS